MFISHYLKNRIGRAVAFGLALGLLLNCVPTLAHWPIRFAQAGPQATTKSAAVLAPTPLLSEPVGSEAQVVQAYGQLGLSFEANHGQTDARVDFITHAPGATVYITPTEAVMVLSAVDESGTTSASELTVDSTADVPPVRKRLALRMKIEGGSATPEVHGLDELPGKVNYFIGNDPANWRSNIPTFARVEYKNVYPGIDMIYYGNQRHLEYDFRLAPRADVHKVALKFEGAEGMEVDAEGNLLIDTKLGTVRQLKPVVYQELEGERCEVQSGYALTGGGRVGFSIGRYDRTQPLIIDPVLAYSTFLGGSNTDSARGISVDSSGNAYVTGVTSSDNFPTFNEFDNSPNGGNDAFVTKLNAAGSTLIYSTYFGGSGSDVGENIAVDSAGNAYVIGLTGSANFPTANALDNTLNGNLDSFVTKVNVSGSALVYSTYLGGSETESGNEIAVDSAGNAYVIGSTASTDFPTASPIQSAHGGGGSDAFVAKLNASASALTYSTYLGGSGFETGNGIAVDLAGDAYVIGLTGSANFPTTNALDNSLTGLNDAFVTKLNVSGSALVYSTYLGGSSQDGANGIAVDFSGNVYLTGSTSSSDFPTANPLDNVLSGNADAFATKLNPTGSALVYSTLLGGDDLESGNDIAIDRSGNACFTGTTDSSNFPTANEIQSTYGGGVHDAFVAKLTAGGTPRVYSTFLGGGGSDEGRGIAVDSAGNVYVVGFTFSQDFPISPNPAQELLASPNDAFVAKIGEFSISGRVIDAAGQSLAGVTLTMSGSSSGVTQTDVSGYFAFLNTFLNGAYTVTAAKDGFDFTPSQHGIGSLSANQEIVFVGSSTGPLPTPTPTPMPEQSTIQFLSATTFVGEGGVNAVITVTRTGNTSASATVDYRTADTDNSTVGCGDVVNNLGWAFGRCDFAVSLDTITFASGETSKAFTVPIIDDSYAEGLESFSVVLSNPSGTTLGTPAITTVSITDNDLVNGTNPASTTPFFVRQHYLDFLSRDPDTAGFTAWVGVLNNCSDVNNNPACDRILVSSSFFGSQEFQLKGYFVYRFYKLAFNRLPTYTEIVNDMRAVSGATSVEMFQKKAAFTNTFVQRTEFANAYDGLSNANFVSTLMGRYTLTQITTPDPANPDGTNKVMLTASDLTNRLNGMGGMLTRAQVLRAIADSDQVFNTEFNQAFVAMQYYGYLRRAPDTAGLNAWLNYLNAHPTESRTMVSGFMNSAEYRLRFGPLP